ncbi:MAG: two-component regulator propeller domain-containing protein [Paludibacteraceae bacterium]
MTKHIALLFLGIFLCFHSIAPAEPLCHIHHYSTEDGIPQYNIMDMLQDKKGYLWLATWDGLSKFDGYEFKNYKAHSADKYFMRSNRIEKLYQDKYGRIWLKSYDGDNHCFNPATESFWGIQSIENTTTHKIATVTFQPSGKIWLILDTNGCILLKDSTFNLDDYNVKNGKLNSDKIYNIIEDSKLNTWILTDNGIKFISRKNDSKNYFTGQTGANENNQAFFSGVELANELWFGSQNGRIWRVERNNGKNKLLQLPFHSDIIHFRKISEDYVCVFEKRRFCRY